VLLAVLKLAGVCGTAVVRHHPVPVRLAVLILAVVFSFRTPYTRRRSPAKKKKHFGVHTRKQAGRKGKNKVVSDVLHNA
jgi:hypothetical protein